MAALMRRDAPHRINPDEDIVSICDSSNIEMVSTHEYDRETEDSSPDSDAEDSHHPSDGSDMIRIEAPVGIPTWTPNRALIPVLLRDLMPIWAATMVVTPSPVMTTGVISQTCSRQKNNVPVPPRDPNHGHLLTAAADPRKPRTKNNGTFLPQKTIPILTSQIRRKRNPIGRKLLPKPLPRWSPFRTK